MSDLKKKFDAAAADSKNLSKAPGNDVKLKMYGLFKQGSAGDVTGSRPGLRTWWVVRSMALGLRSRVPVPRTPCSSTST